ncbi:MAG: dehydrogenase [Syntrophobacteraceae bacterium CG07_land_8_20_14_0_80_61_8]|nr:MAG: dehydrogenase [Syntrophobacteraceae bacterium CG07_land_8_20_14_0_80_61_8]
MATEVVMPKWGLTMKEGKITRWFKAEGDPVGKGEPLFEVETSKITNAVEAPAAGTLFQILAPAGTTVAVKTVVAVLVEPGEETERRPLQPLAGAQEPTAAEPTDQAPVSSAPAFVPASPIARRLAKSRGIDLALVRGTGPGGRVTEKDVLEFEPAARVDASPQAIALAAKAGLDLERISGSGPGARITKADVLKAMSGGGPAPAAGPETREATIPQARAEAAPTAAVAEPGVIPLAGMRRVIADNMMASLHQSAQLTVFVEVDAGAMTDLRDLLRARPAEPPGPRISYNDIIALAVCRALKEFPIMNSWLTEEGIVVHRQVNLGVAVALDDGLVVPNVKNADRMGLQELAPAIRALADRARQGGLTLDEIQGGTFTITNVSMLGVDGFTPILNPPETAILGVGRASDQAAVVRGEICVRKKMTLSLTFDHRVVDGAPAMRFLRTLADYLEQPLLLLT